MRKVFLLCTLTIPLLLFPGCFWGGAEQNLLDEALTVRGEYLALTDLTAQAQIHADYGLRVYDFTLDVAVREEETLLTVTAPDLIAGITARHKPEQSWLEYEGLMLETGPLNGDGLTPMYAVPALLEALRGAYIRTCSIDRDGLLRLDCGDSDLPPGQGTEYVLFLHPDTHDLVRGEILQDGFCCLTCTFSQLTKE